MRENKLSASKEERFHDARMAVLSDKYSDEGIGTYKEKTLHKIVKLFIEPNKEFHEIRYKGAIADIKKNNKIFEVQTRHLSALCPKLEKFLEDSYVTVVYPLPYEKVIRWIDKDSGQISKPRKSPKKSSVFDAAYELYNIRRFIGNEKFSLKLLFINVDDFKYKGGKVINKSKKSVRVDRVPKDLVKVIDFNSPEDYLIFIPDGLPDKFTASAFQKTVSKKFKYGYSVIQILLEVGILKAVEKVGRKTLYSLK